MSRVSKRRNRNQYKVELRHTLPHGTHLIYLFESRKQAQKFRHITGPGFILPAYTNPIRKRSTR